MTDFDVVSIQKIESSEEGGTENNLMPSDLDPREDGFAVKGIAFIHNETSEQIKAKEFGSTITRDAEGNLLFKDPSMGNKTLSQLFAGASQDTLAHTFSRVGVNLGSTWLLFSGVPSNSVGAPISLTLPKLISVTFASLSTCTLTLGIYEHTGNLENLVKLSDFSVVNKSFESFKNLDITLSEGKQLAVLVETITERPRDIQVICLIKNSESSQ